MSWLLCNWRYGLLDHPNLDLEVWLPAQNTYREISSISNMVLSKLAVCKRRFRNAQGKTEFVSYFEWEEALAAGRTLVAVLENYQQADGSVIIPEVLILTGGAEKLEAK